MPFTQNQNVTFVYQPQAALGAIINANGTSPIAIYIGGANGSKVAGSIIASSTDTASRDVLVGVNVGGNATLGSAITGGTSITFGAVAVPAGAGQSGAVPPVNLMPTIMPIDSDGEQYLFLPAAAFLFLQMVVAIASGKQLSYYVPAIGDF